MALSEFLVVYDYGNGGVWGLARAASADEVIRVLPELKIVNETPDWMTAGLGRRPSSFVVSEPGSYPDWLRTLVAERNGS